MVSLYPVRSGAAMDALFDGCWFASAEMVEAWTVRGSVSGRQGRPSTRELRNTDGLGRLGRPCGARGSGRRSLQRASEANAAASASSAGQLPIRIRPPTPSQSPGFETPAASTHPATPSIKQYIQKLYCQEIKIQKFT